MADLTIKSKLPKVGETIFTEMSVLANKHNAINLGQGFPDFPMSEELVERVHHYMTTGHNQYVHMNGLPLLRQVIADKVCSLYDNAINAESEITVTPGATYAIYTALTTVLQPGDEVIVFEPAYDSYIPNIEINGGVPVLIELTYPDYKIDWKVVKSKITPKTRMIMINTPHNPSGSVLSSEDIEQLRAIVKDTGIFILSDEVYEHLIYDNKKHESLLRYPDLFSRTFVTFSFGKTFHCTGWKMGYCIASANLMAEYRKVHQFNCFTCNTPIQFAIADILKNRESYLGLPSFMQAKRDYFEQKMKQTKFTPLPSYGSYFQLYSYRNISNESEKDFAIRLTRDYGVATIPTSAFYKNGTDNHVLRFCFAKKQETIDAAIERLLKV
jgi:methionine transaminase